MLFSIKKVPILTQTRTFKSVTIEMIYVWLTLFIELIAEI